MKKRLLIIVLFGSILIGCEKDKNEINLQDIYTNLNGAWSWEKTVIQYRAQDDSIVQNPISENKIVEYVFSVQNKNLTISENGKVVETYNYEITEDPNNQDNKESDFILVLENKNNESTNQSSIFWIDVTSEKLILYNKNYSHIYFNRYKK